MRSSCTDAFGAASLEVAVALHKLADCQWNQERYDLAIEGYKRALAIGHRKLGATNADTIESQDAVVQCEAKIKAATDTPTLVAALRRKEQQLGVDHPDLLALLADLQSRYNHEGNSKEESAVLARIVAILDKTGDKQTLAAKLLRDAARSQVHQGHYPEAVALWTRAIAAAEHGSEDKNEAQIYAREGLTSVHLTMGHLAEAEQQCKTVLDLRERIYGADHIDLAYSLGSLANIYSTAGRWAEAETLYQRCLAIREKHAPPDSPLIATALNNLGSLCCSLALLRGRAHVARALAIREQAYGQEDLLVAESLANLGAAIRSQGRDNDAIPLYDRALAIREKLLGPDHLDLTTSLTSLGNYHLRLGDYDEAEKLYQRASAIQLRVLVPATPISPIRIANWPAWHSIERITTSPKPCSNRPSRRSRNSTAATTR